MSRTYEVDELDVRVFDDVATLARAAAVDAADALRSAIADRGEANVMLATGNSQLVFLAELVTFTDVDWSCVAAFHMDEYVDLPPTHTASFQRYMRERVASRVPFRQFNYLRGDTGDAAQEARRYADLLRAHPLDLCCCGIGENGHLAFNDPPVADFTDPLDVKLVELDDACKAQQVGEGHFADAAAVPPTAITVTIPALLRAGSVLVIVPDARKAEPVRSAFTGPVSTRCPASILQRTPHATVYLDSASAAGLPASSS
jgi:glucosamine-6-phosphate deaminase